ncbi:MAG: endonuclease III [Christensenellales bacterium]
MKPTQEEILNQLSVLHPTADCELQFSNPFELLVAVVLSAQCTDKRVNEVTSKLFKVCNTPQGFADMPVETLEKYIFSCGFYHNKAKSIKALSKSLIDDFNGIVPNNMDDLKKLSGVGSKTANVVYAVGFGGAGLAVDTHVFRVANRLGIVNEKTPLATEIALKKFFDKDYWSKAHHLLLFHGRYICKSQNPDCAKCPFTAWCEHYKEKKCTK